MLEPNGLPQDRIPDRARPSLDPEKLSETEKRIPVCTSVGDPRMRVGNASRKELLSRCAPAAYRGRKCHVAVRSILRNGRTMSPG